MPAQPTLSHLNVPLPQGTPATGDPGRELFRERLAFYAKVLFSLCFGFYIFGNLLFVLIHDESWSYFVVKTHNLFHLLASALLFGMWWLASRGKPSYSYLLRIDAWGTVVTCAAYSLVSLTQDSVRAEYQAVLGLTSTLIGRAILVPCNAWRTFAVGLASAVPVVLVGHIVYLRPEIRSTFRSSYAFASAVLSLWCVVAIVLSTVASKVIYGLRREVSQAKQLGQYTLEEKIGSGGMGEVYRARHALLRRPTAVKLIRPNMGGERNIARFEREVQMTSRLTHPNTVAIYDYGRTPEGVFYYAMEYLPGLTLDELVRQDGAQPPGRVIHILSQVCASLSEAHGIGLIHRDIKAANVILCERGGLQDVGKVVDFGLVKDTDGTGDVSISAANTITGTPHYLSPEGIRSPGRVDARSDLYAVGVLGYFLLTGKQVFEAESFVEICGHHLHTQPVPPSVRVSRVLPRDLEGLIMSCLEKDPEKRPLTAADLGRALRACADASGWNEEKAAIWWKEHAKKTRDAVSPSEPTAVLAAPETLSRVPLTL